MERVCGAPGTDGELAGSYISTGLQTLTCELGSCIAVSEAKIFTWLGARGEVLSLLQRDAAVL